MKGEFSSPKIYEGTRAYLRADGKEMSDLWVFDYAGGQLAQSVRQVPSDSAWGVVTMPLTYGTHHIYFVASRGKSAVIDTLTRSISWGTVSDTFWKDYEVTVGSTSNGNRAITLDRVVTRLKIDIEDKVPEGLSAISIVPSVWYSGLNYVGGTATGATSGNIDVSVPESAAGTEGVLAVAIFSISPADEWYADVAVSAKKSNGDIAGSALLEGVPLMRNRTTEYTGRLFGTETNLGLSLDDAWKDTYKADF